MDFWKTSLFSILFIMIYSSTEARDASEAGQKKLHPIHWTKDEVFVSGDKGNNKAFRDHAIERILWRIIRRHLTADKIVNVLNVQDPLAISEDFSLNEKNDLVELNFQANKLRLYGLSGISVKYIRVIRHFGLNDIKIQMTFSTDLRLQGNYEAKGHALAGIFPITGEGAFSMNITTVKMSIITHAAIGNSQNPILMKDLEIGIGFEEQSFHFENLMGGGFSGQTANGIINTVGKSALQKNLNLIKDLIKEKYKSVINSVL